MGRKSESQGKLIGVAGESATKLIFCSNCHKSFEINIFEPISCDGYKCPSCGKIHDVDDYYNNDDDYDDDDDVDISGLYIINTK